MAKFLNDKGVSKLWNKIKSVFATKTEVKNDHYTKLEVDRIQQGNVNALNNKLDKVNPTLENTNLRIVDGMVTGELNLRPEFHAIRLGQTDRDYCEFTEWGGTFRFFQCDSNTGVPGNKLAEINPNGVYYKESKLATEADTLPYKPMNGGLIPQESSSSWGVQTGQETASWADNAGGGLKIRRNCPIDGQMSLVIDGTVYVNEGNNAVYHDGNLIFSLSGSTLTITKR